jgi:hypothetical protein
MLLLVPLLHAHPGSTPGASGAVRDTIGHRVELSIGPRSIELHYIAELPERRVLKDARGTPDYSKELLASLADGVRITWDGATLPSTPLAVAEPAKAGEPGYLDFTIAKQAALPATTGTVGVSIGTYPDEEGFFATSVLLDGILLGEETSLLKVKGGRIRDNWHGAWVKGDDAREPWVKIRPAGWTERLSGPQPLPKRMVGIEPEAMPTWAYGVLGLGLVAIGWLGRTLGRQARRLRRSE